MARFVDQSQFAVLAGRNAGASVDGLKAETLVAAPASAFVDGFSMTVLYGLRPPVSAFGIDDKLEVLVEGAATFYADSTSIDALVEGLANFYADNTALAVLYDYREISPNVKLYDPMSDYLFPTLPGLTWDIVKRPVFSTAIVPHVSGREVRVSSYAYPLWTWEMTYEFLRAGAEAELQCLMGFFLARSGSFDTFLYKDPDEENELEDVVLGIGNSVQTRWSMTKAFGGFVEPCGYVDPDSIHVYFSTGEITVEQFAGWSFVSPNQIVFDAAVPVGVVVRADYCWYYRVRFGEDSQDYSQFMYQLWELNALTLQSVKP
ncbi:MAG: DUF2460 domain-containing protein [Chlorobiaceae bacterium]|nr:DUF2460 domain-containing protein [Chlorobiaceae bacterium]